MTHERARFLLTLFGAVAPAIVLGLVPVILIWAAPYAALVGLLIIMGALFIIVGHALLVALTVFWGCGECGRQYFAFFMPYWPFDRDCQNCHTPD